MKVVILAGGLGTRISEETLIKPKPLIEIGSKPIIWHIMKIYSHFGLRDFIICCGHKGYLLKEYFANYSLHNMDFTADLSKNKIKLHKRNTEPWKVTLIDTGEESNTGERIKRIRKYVDDDFCLTYGDGLGSVNIKKIIQFHRNKKKYATVVAVRPLARFGIMALEGEKVKSFSEKPLENGGWVNGGFFVLNKKIFDYLGSNNSIWEKEPLEKLCSDGQLNAFTHNGFWHPMDTLRDKNYLENLWSCKKAPWKLWND